MGTQANHRWHRRPSRGRNHVDSRPTHRRGETWSPPNPVLPFSSPPRTPRPPRLPPPPPSVAVSLENQHHHRRRRHQPPFPPTPSVVVSLEVGSLGVLATTKRPPAQRPQLPPLRSVVDFLEAASSAAQMRRRQQRQQRQRRRQQLQPSAEVSWEE